jgi:hypothetical protein
MAIGRIIGLVVLVVGAALLIIGFNATDSLVERASETFTGRYSNQTTWYLIGGAAALVGGGALALFGAKNAP